MEHAFPKISIGDFSFTGLMCVGLAAVHCLLLTCYVCQSIAMSAKTKLFDNQLW